MQTNVVAGQTYALQVARVKGAEAAYDLHTALSRHRAPVGLSLASLQQTASLLDHH